MQLEIKKMLFQKLNLLQLTVGLQVLLVVLVKVMYSQDMYMYCQEMYRLTSLNFC